MRYGQIKSVALEVLLSVHLCCNLIKKARYTVSFGITSFVRKIFGSFCTPTSNQRQFDVKFRPALNQNFHFGPSLEVCRHFERKQHQCDHFSCG